ncbi:DUF262 domain-containing HNH endonuclease family protein [Novosphingobium sp. MMS21-SN21R]|uniref:DUF262 domain-containing protein n=1 Tax=Novosphingobium sp. MMS21-SN21R TaxID=2969298 RepID=UPI0028861E26|nr:DUF262 domain-containing HNH endonuclease family protein [Novosphingobium sp. MMS21-SN21R]MDT0507454.1 DUF262 domain-containing HNH endonuclease family protein [Novosphingobium sp. MMS21-SN21R]
MTKKISGAEYPLSKIFSSDFEYVIPSYQRPYAWGADQASELFEDLLAFHQAEDEEGYFLGSIVLIKSEDRPFAEVIDGQQRLTTLTILLAAMACAHDGAYRDELRTYITEPGKELEGIKAKPRLSLRERDRQFFAKYIQGLDLDTLLDLDAASLSNESQQNIQNNCAHFVKDIASSLGGREALKSFVTFLLTRCYLVVVSTPSQASAFRVFSVMNSRGLDLQPTDIIKADMIGKIKGEEDRQKYNDKWEEMEVDLTRSGFNDLFTYIRMIYAKDKAKRTLLEEFRTYVLPENPDAKSFIDDVLDPFSDALEDIRSASYESTKQAETINYYISWLNRIDNSDWIPPAMLFLKKYRNKPDRLATFFELLERLAAYMHICRFNVNERIDIYANLISEIEEGKAPDDMDYLGLDEEEKATFRDALDGKIYDLTPRRRNYLILRLDSIISDGAATYDPKVLTIEHVLPQTVSDGSQWEEWWPDVDERKAWVHRLANLVPLNKKKNSAAQNYDFEHKCDIYFKGVKNVSSYALTSQVISETEWTPAVIEARQEALLDALIENWGLEEE